MNYSETLEYLYSMLPMYSRQGAIAMKKDLGNIIKLCEALGNPQEKFKSVHIAGTNGKGSTSHMLAAVLQEAGFNVGLYTSPHIKEFTERIRLNGQEVSQEAVVEFTRKSKGLIEEIKPSFFEITVAMAFDYFADQEVDIAVVETGLGGLLDSTNILKPMLSIITNIGLDHTDMLGDTLELIAEQKAGIIKDNTAVVISETQAETESVFVQESMKKNAPIVFADKIYDTVKLKGVVNFINRSSAQALKIECDLKGSYQTKNIKGVLLALDILSKKGFQTNNEHVQSGLKQTKKLTGIRGRFEIIQNKPLVIFDTAHNADGIQLSLNQLKEYEFENPHIVLGFVNDKPLENVLKLFPKDASYYFTQANIPRALEAVKLKEMANSLSGLSFERVVDAFESAKENASEEDAILVIGSFFLLSELYPS